MPTRDTAVLVVDDEEPLRKLIDRMLSRAGLQVQTAASGEEALDILRLGRRFDTIVSDLMMPGMDGMQFLREIRQLDLDVPMIFLTGNPSLSTAMEAMEQGGFRYLAKPVEAKRLVAIVKDAAAHHRLALLKRKGVKLTGVDLSDECAVAARRNGYDATFSAELASLPFAAVQSVHH